MPKRLSPASVACALGLSAVTTAHASEHRLAIIPQPQEVMIGEGAVSLRGRRVRLVDDQGRTLTSGAASILSRWLQADHGIASVAEPAPAAQTVEVRLSIKPDAAPQPHGYRLVVNDQGIELTGVDEPGLFYAAATFNQLIDHGADHEPRVSHAAIRDWPRFSYRGFMIDSVRKFQPAAWLKSQIEQAAKYKLNVFHWHLTDDQGWRLPVAGWPRLTEIGAWRMRSVNQQIGNKWVEIVRWPGNGHHYGLAEWPATRDEHAQLAQQFDADGVPGQLLQIDTPDEQRFVQQLIARRHDDQVRWWGIDQDDADASAQRFAVYEFPTASTQAARDSAGGIRSLPTAAGTRGRRSATSSPSPPPCT